MSLRPGARAHRVQMIKKRIVKARRAARRSRYAITRIESKPHRTFAWIVSVQRRKQIWRRTFSDRSYGGKTKALTAAKAFRDQILSQHPPMSRAEYCRIKRRNNKSGLAGVCRYLYPECTSGQQSNAAIGWHSGRSRPARPSGSSSRSTALANAALSNVLCVHAGKHWQRWTGSGSTLRVCGIGCARTATLADHNERHRASLVSADAPRQSPL